MTAISRFSSAARVTTVDISTYGDGVKLTSQDSKKYAGFLNSPALRQLLDRSAVRLKATLYQESQQKLKPPKKAAKPSNGRPVKIVVFGMQQDSDAIGDVLSQAGLYLQHPSGLDYDEYTKYCNPHYLLRPGSQMPNLETLSVAGGAQTGSEMAKRDEVYIARLLRIFDCDDTTGVKAPVTLDPSPRLSSTLLE